MTSSKQNPLTGNAKDYDDTYGAGESRQPKSPSDAANYHDTPNRTGGRKRERTK